MREIPLTKGYVALVDDEDYERVNAFKWFAAPHRRCIYARREEVRDGKRVVIRMHRFIMGCPEDVDHADNDGLNNQRYNLRPANNGQNQANMRKQKRQTSSRFKGVYLHRQTGKWVAQVNINGKKTNLGLFRDEVDAAQAYNFAAEEAFGGFARLNVPLV